MIGPEAGQFNGGLAHRYNNFIVQFSSEDHYKHNGGNTRE